MTIACAKGAKASYRISPTAGMNWANFMTIYSTRIFANAPSAEA
jgi:hypothetical protein